MSRWVEKRLGDCASFLSGGTPARDNSAFWEGEVPWASNKDMKVGRLHDTVEHISSDAAESSSKLVPADSLLLVVRGMALAKMLPIAITQQPMAFNQDLKALKPKTGISGVFLYYWFVANTNYVLSKADEAAHGTKRLQTPTLEELLVRFPVELSEQNRIVNQLGQMDDWIENCEQRIELLEEAARLIYMEWFVRRRPSRLHATLSTEQRAAKLEDAVWINPKTPIETGKEAPFVPMTALSQTGMVIEGIEQRAIGGGAKFQNGDTLLARITPCLENGKTGFVQFLDDENPVASGSTEFIVLRSRRVNPYWIYCLARTEHFREFAIRSMSGADGRQRVSTNSLAQYPVTIPPAEVLEDFEKTVGPMFEQIHTLTQQIAQLRQARDLLLPRLISGQLRL